MRQISSKLFIFHATGQGPAHMALEAVNFLTHYFARYRLIFKILLKQTQR